jgi:ATP-binding cassette subfamily B protein
MIMNRLTLNNYWTLLRDYIRPQKGKFALLVGLMLFSIVLQVINPQVMRAFIDAALAQEAMQTLLRDALLFIGIALLQQAVSVSVTYLGENVAWNATNALRIHLARHCMNLDLSFHNQHTPGELIERIDGDVTEVANFFSQFVITLVGNLLLLAGILVALFRENSTAGVVFTVYAVLALVALGSVRNIAMPYEKARREASAKLFGFVEEQLNSTEDVRALGAVPYSLKRLFHLQGEVLRHERKSGIREWLINNVVGIVLAVGNMLAIGLGYVLYRDGAITIGTVYLFVHYINLIEGPIWALTRQIESFQRIGACVERLTELSQTQPAVQEVSEPHPLPGVPAELAFDRVSFHYDQDELLLKDFSFQLQPKKVLGLLGRTGSGKTTLTRLILRLYDPKAGQVTLGGVDLRQAGLKALRQHVAIVTQEVQLFRASLRDNLTFFDRSISDEKILDAIRTLELEDWYSTLPNGLDTLLESGGKGLSAGEAQLLAFTRVFLRQPGLVILDEASSRVDPATSTRIERAIQRLLQGRSAIIIAHRLETVERVDEIMILERGSIAEHGPRQALADDPASLFHRLLQTGLEEVLV